MWVTNVGAIKPLKQQLSFYAKLAWEADGDANRDVYKRQQKYFVKGVMIGAVKG